MFGFCNIFDKLLYVFVILWTYYIVCHFWFQQVLDSELSDISVGWEMPDASTLLHPIYFAKCLTKVNTAWVDNC